MRFFTFFIWAIFGWFSLLFYCYSVIFLHDFSRTDHLISGSIYTALGGIYFYLKRRKSRDIAWLRSHGQLIMATVSKVEESMIQGRNGRRYYYVHSHWQDPASGKKYTFSTPTLDFNPNSGAPVGSTIRVYIEPGKPEHHYIDTDAILRPQRYLWE